MTEKTTVVPEKHLMNDEDAMRNIGSFADALQTVRESGTQVESTEDYGDGFKLLTTAQKVQVVGVPFVIVDGRFNTGDQGEFVTLYVVTEDDRKLILNDGSTGILAQAKKYAEHRNGSLSGLLVPRGLVRSDYVTVIDGKETAATTYYLS